MNTDKYFQTTRIQIITEDVRHSKYSTYYVIQRDPVQAPQQLKGLFVREGSDLDMRGKWLMLPEAKKRRDAEDARADAQFSFSSSTRNKERMMFRSDFAKRGAGWDAKARAIKIAQEQAVLLKLPFSPAKDVIDEEEVYWGPVTPCTGCGKTKKRTYVSFLCDKCKVEIETGRSSISERHLYGIAVDHIIKVTRSLSVRNTDEEDLAQALAAVAGTELGQQTNKYQIEREVKGIIGEERTRELRSLIPIKLSERQAEGMQNVIRLLNLIAENALDEGRKKGASVITRLSQGEISLEELDKYNVELGQRLQKNHATTVKTEPLEDEEIEDEEEGEFDDDTD